MPLAIEVLVRTVYYTSSCLKRFGSRHIIIPCSALILRVWILFGVQSFRNPNQVHVHCLMDNSEPLLLRSKFGNRVVVGIQTYRCFVGEVSSGLIPTHDLRGWSARQSVRPDTISDIDLQARRCISRVRRMR
jgi:hypothetical protein